MRGEIAGRARRGGDLSGKALEDRFTGAPYGWHPVIVRLILAAMFRSGIVSVKAENVHYTDPAAPAGQALLTQVRPFRRAVFFYEEAEAVTPAELRRAQDELKVIFDAARREETANALAEQITQELRDRDGRAERVLLQLRPAGYPIPPAIQNSAELAQRITRSSNPAKVVKAFLAALDEVRAWHDETQVLHEFLRRKRLPVYQAATWLLAELGRSDGVRGAEALAAEDAQAWQDALRSLASNGRAAHEWEQFTASLNADIHAHRDRALAESETRLQGVGVPATALDRYRCPGLRWTDGATKCAACDISLRELDLQITALPGEERRLRDQARPVYRPEAGQQPARPRVKYLKVSEVLAQGPTSARITSEGDLEQALSALRDEVKRSLTEADAVELE